MVNTKGISKDDAWARFMKLTQEARMRNSGLVHSSTAVSGTKRDSLRTNSSPLVINGVSYNKSKPEAKRMILGGKFDAYA
jgi:hypothetical protein